MLASEVDDLSYGDCKALTNYTMALLENQGIKAYYSVVYGDSDIRDIDSSFVGMQGNHVILNIPNGNDNIWLECTSQKVPFNHIAGFTDDRDVLVITPEGGIIKHTKVFKSAENYSKVVAKISLRNDGGFNADFTEKAAGTRYDSRLRVMESDAEDRALYYNKRWDYLNAINVEDIDFANDYELAEIKGNAKIQSKSYGSIVTDKMLVKPNIFDRSSYVPPRYSKRKLPLQIQRGYLNESTFEWQLPEGFEVASIPEQVVLNSKFGTYSFSIEPIDNSKLIYKRKLEIFKGDYQKTDYKDYRSFRREITKADKASIVLKRKTE